MHGPEVLMHCNLSIGRKRRIKTQAAITEYCCRGWIMTAEGHSKLHLEDFSSRGWWRLEKWMCWHCLPMVSCNTGESAEKIIYYLLLKHLLKWEQSLISSRAPLPITGFCFNWIGKRKYGQSALCEAGELGKQPHNESVWQWGQICSGGDKLKCFNPIYPETIC